MGDFITIQAPKEAINSTIQLPASKSIANRALIIQALAKEDIALQNLSKADDTLILQELLKSETLHWDAGMAGTAFRFLTAFLSIHQHGKTYTLTGHKRMKQRPIAPLVDALKSIGAAIKYLEKENFPPIEITSTDIEGGAVSIPANISSQFISALMMIAPCFPKGLQISLDGKITSRPYITMTQELMQYFGAEVTFDKNDIFIHHKGYESNLLKIESDWSAASYYYSIVALADKATIRLPKLYNQSWQGDSIVADIFYRLGVQSSFEGDELVLTKTENCTHYLAYDFADCPDLAQTVVVTCVGLQISGEFTGLESLRIKETDRISALQQEIKKLGWVLEENDETWFLKKDFSLKPSFSNLQFNTYNDHRMAMSFAPLALIYDKIIIESPKVVSKSNPDFWGHLGELEFLTSH